MNLPTGLITANIVSECHGSHRVERYGRLIMGVLTRDGNQRDVSEVHEAHNLLGTEGSLVGVRPLVIGAGIGAWMRGAAKRGAQVMAIEPEQCRAAVCKLNTADEDLMRPQVLRMFVISRGHPAKERVTWRVEGVQTTQELATMPLSALQLLHEPNALWWSAPALLLSHTIAGQSIDRAIRLAWVRLNSRDLSETRVGLINQFSERGFWHTELAHETLPGRWLRFERKS